ncbi:bacterial low temperature requirement A protein-domain-containing protein [Exophiala viscosa]|uniref:bacterial low temperature requirement A protein-domain-containing protein n=1 Tax=Exophiala viscosa TaxID=2486360 RepID=UPI002191E1ED|nr:bacterial low temperature requirement A protein-domain-containing protein [Exophiala viscosa]
MDIESAPSSPTRHGANNTTTTEKNALGAETTRESSKHGGHPASLQEEDVLEYRSRHKYMISRPRALQYTYKSQVYTSEGDLTEQSGEEAAKEAGIDKARERLDLFIDLIWVGIISNLSEVFSSDAFGSEGASSSKAFLFFAVVFLPSWRVWNGIREILNNYYMDDVLQRTYIFLLLVLSIFFGNNLAYITEFPERAKILTISLYLFIRSSLVLIECVYAIFIPWLRRLVLLTSLLYLPSIGLWTAGIYLDGAKALGPIFAAVVMDYTVPIILDSTKTRDALLSGYGKAIDPHHFTSRMGSFFIITLGEGVLQLVKDGPLGIGVTRTCGLAVWSLCIYFLLAQIYFNRDGSRVYIPAVLQKGWRTWLWLTYHIPTFMSTLTLSAGIMFIIQQSAAKFDAETGDSDTETLSEEEIIQLTRNAIWTVSISLAIVMMAMFGMALLNQPRDQAKSLRVNNRYLRLAGRPLYAVIVLAIASDKNIGTETYLGTCSLLMVCLSIWEYSASMEKTGGFLERKKSPSSSRVTSHE